MTTSESDIIRNITVNNGREIRRLIVTRDADGLWLRDASDVNRETREFLADDSDSSICDVLDPEWEIVFED